MPLPALGELPHSQHALGLATAGLSQACVDAGEQPELGVLL